MEDDRGRHDLRAVFNRAAEDYQRSRPVLPPGLFDDLIYLAGLRPGDRVIEIGCGTGQATVPLAERGLAVTAVELGAELAAIARRRVAGFPAVEVVTSSFEDWRPPPGAPADAVVAVNCLHWIDPELRYAKPHGLLRPGGAMVVAGCGRTEYVPQAPAGLRLLSEHPAIDPARLYLAGHSLGGSVAPRIAAAAAATAAAGPAVAGMIILAGGAQPLHWSAVRQFGYLATITPGGAAALQPALDAITAQAKAVDDPGLSAATPQETLPFGIPAPYWLDLRGYDPPAAAALGKPMLILQGGRDYQVTTDDDLSRWQAALGNRPDVTIRVYDADNHLFFPGSGPSSPEEYEPAQHIDPQVIADAAAWLRGPGTALC